MFKRCLFNPSCSFIRNKGDIDYLLRYRVSPFCLYYFHENASTSLLPGTDLHRRKLIVVRLEKYVKRLNRIDYYVRQAHPTE